MHTNVPLCLPNTVLFLICKSCGSCDQDGSCTCSPSKWPGFFEKCVGMSSLPSSSVKRDLWFTESMYKLLWDHMKNLCSSPIKQVIIISNWKQQNMASPFDLFQLESAEFLKCMTEAGLCLFVRFLFCTYFKLKASSMETLTDSVAFRWVLHFSNYKLSLLSPPSSFWMSCCSPGDGHLMFAMSLASANRDSHHWGSAGGMQGHGVYHFPDWACDHQIFKSGCQTSCPGVSAGGIAAIGRWGIHSSALIKCHYTYTAESCWRVYLLASPHSALHCALL